MRRVRSTNLTGALVALALALAGAGAALVPSALADSAPAAPVPATALPVTTPAGQNPFAGRGMWIWYISASDGGSLGSIIATAHAHGVRTLMIKAGDGSSAWSQFNSGLVARLHAGGLRVCAWQYVYGAHPLAEAAVGATAVRAGADCLLIDAEAQYEGRYVAAQRYITRLRQRIGAGFPVALASFPYVDYHPAFPYSVFLGPGAAQYNAPQMYWVDIGTTVDAVYAHTYDYNRLYARPIAPLGQVYNHPPPRQVMRFRQLARAYGAPGVSWWDWQEAAAPQWHALTRPTPAVAADGAPSWQPPTLGTGSAGDLVVWAQEHLVGAGQAVPVTGRYGQRTRAAVRAFRLAHGLTPSGVVDAATWAALLRYAPAQVTWTPAGARAAIPPPPASAPVPASASATAARRTATDAVGLVAPLPSSASLRPRRDEIPGRLGAG